MREVKASGSEEGKAMGSELRHEQKEAIENVFKSFDWNSDINLGLGEGCIRDIFFMFTLGRLCAMHAL